MFGFVTSKSGVTQSFRTLQKIRECAQHDDPFRIRQFQSSWICRQIFSPTVQS